MGLRRSLQDHPWFLVQAWRATAAVLVAARSLFERLGLDRSSRWVEPVERPIKHWLFDCRMCGQCVLHYTGMTCPMTCPKQIRNGPCGGVSIDGRCEVDPGQPCVWVDAITRLPKTPWAKEIARLNPPVDWQLEERASWVSFALGRDQVTTGSDAGVRYIGELDP